MNFNFRLNSYDDRISLNINENDKWSELANGDEYLNTIFSKVDNGNNTVETKEINLLQRLYNIMIKFFGGDDCVDCEQLSEKIENSSINLEQIRENLEAEDRNDYKTTEKTITMGGYNVKVTTTNKVVEKCHHQDLANGSPVVNAYTGSLEITNSKTGKAYTINLTWDTTLPDDAIEKLLNALQETINIVPEAVAEDIFMENNDFYIFDGKNYADFNAFAGNDKITLVYENMQGETALRPRVLIHETGHNVNFTKDDDDIFRFFDKNNHEAGYEKFSKFRAKLRTLYQNDQFPKIYALGPCTEFFAEYYAYKAVGDRKDLINDRGAAYLFDSMKASGDPEQLAILEYMDKMIEEIHNKPIDDRVGYDRINQ